MLKRKLLELHILESDIGEKITIRSNKQLQLLNHTCSSVEQGIDRPIIFAVLLQTQNDLIV